MTSTPHPSGSCDYCGLPLPRPLLPRWLEEPATSGPQYCCTGCRFAAAVTRERGAEGAAGWTLASLGLSIFFSMSVMVFTIALWSYDAYPEGDPASAAMAAAFGDLLRWLCLVFALPVLLLLGRPLAAESLMQLRRGRLTADLLLLTGVLAAYAFSTWSVLQGGGDVYFETGCVILVFVTLGRWLGAQGRLQTTAALDSLQRLLPDTVRRVTAGRWETVPLEELAPGETVLVLAGERLPIDGVIVQGAAAIDEQVFTGESTPVEREVGSTVFAGTLNLDGTLYLRATVQPREGAFGALLAAVRNAREAQGQYQSMADRLARLMFPVIALLALGTTAVHARWHGWPSGLLAGLSVVLIACPCALALATPLAVWAALGRAARHGVLFRSGEALERLATVRALRFDKTGTLTTGSPQVVALCVDQDQDAAEVTRRATALGRESSHIFSRAIVRWGTAAGRSERCEIRDARTVPGAGIEAYGNDAAAPMRLGRWTWLRDCGAVASAELEQCREQAEAAGRSIVGIAWDGRIRGVFALAEEVRPGASEVLEQLRGRGCDVAMLTGDHPQRAEQLAAHLQIDCQAALTPDQKAHAVRQARRQSGPVAMIGDGINDAPALAAADVGIALGCGADVTRESAAVCLLSDDLRRIPWALDLARDTVQVIRGNLAWAFGYNAIGVALAMCGWLHPSIAAVLMVVSSSLVTSRSLRLGGPTDGSALPSPVDERPISAAVAPDVAATVAPPRGDVVREAEVPLAARPGRTSVLEVSP